MSKENDVFGGFDLFNPTSKLKTPNPEEDTKDVKIEAVKTQKELDLDAATSFEENLEKETKEVVKSKEKPKDQTKSTVKDDVSKTEDKPTTKTPIKEEVKEVVEEETPFSFKPVVSYLGEKGILDIDEETLNSLTDDESGLEEAVERTVGSRIDKGVEEWKSSYNSEVQELLKFVELGGKPKDFYDVYYGNTSFEKMKVDSAENQKFVIRQGLKLSGFEDDEINDELKDYEDLGKLEAKATVHLKKLQNWESEQKKALVKSQEEFVEKQNESNKKYWENLKEELTKKEDIQGFKLTPKLKENLWEFIATPSRKSGKTGLQEHNEKNKDAQYLYAYLAMNNWDLSKLKRDVTTEVTSDLRKNLGKFTDSRQKMGGARDNKREDDVEQDHFSGFDKLKI